MRPILNGIKVADLTSIVSGPYATMMLGDLGADVIKVEAPGGDAYRAAPPGRHAGMGAPFMGVNRSKRSLGLDLKAPGGDAVLARLAAWADVVVHNIRPAAAVRLGIDASSLRRHNALLIHCVTTGYGSTGPDADRPAYDDIMQARSGLAGLMADTQGVPRLAPTLVADKVTGLHVAGAILAALLHRERTGEALDVEVPMLETMASFLLAEHMGGHAFDPPIGPPGYNRILSPDRRPHRTADGWIVALPYTTRHWMSFMELVDDPAWTHADWVADPAQRAARVDELYALLAQTFGAKTTAAWLKILSDLDIPSAPVNTLKDVLADPHLAAVQHFQTHAHPTEGAVITPAHPVRYDGQTPSSACQAPVAGADCAVVLGELGYGPEEVRAMLGRGVVWSA
ncbi:MAG: CaiB/BaiF CoA transferase family protein [Euzebya sp.]